LVYVSLARCSASLYDLSSGNLRIVSSTCSNHGFFRMDFSLSLFTGIFLVVYIKNI
jgi:hypothetical protein